MDTYGDIVIIDLMIIDHHVTYVTCIDDHGLSER